MPRRGLDDARGKGETFRKARRQQERHSMQTADTKISWMLPETSGGRDATRPPLRDGHGRMAHYLRLSVTDRCNLNCVYCRSSIRQVFIPHEQILRYEEMARLVGIMASMGVGKLRLTGGEPFARKGFDAFMVMLRERFPHLDLRLTSNGTLLEAHIPLLRRLGINVVNISLDSFDRGTFARISGRDLLPSVLASLDGLLNAGIRVKINAVAMRGVNDRQMDDFAHAARTLPVDVRFIEFMPMGKGTPWGEETFWPAAAIRAEVQRHVRLVPVEEIQGEHGPARMYRVEGGKGRMGFISGVSCQFCATCNRLRLTSDGHIRTCLYDDGEYLVRGLLRNRNCTDEHVARVIRLACARKPVGADLLRSRAEGSAVAEKSMAGIGG